VSAKSAEALNAQIDNYRHFFNSECDTDSIRNASYTSIVGRRHFEHRAVISGTSVKELARRSSDNTAINRGQANLDNDKKVGFLFTGQGSQSLNMGLWLYQNHADFKRTYDLGSEIVFAQEGIDIRGVVYADSPSSSDNQIDQTQIVQPALFLLEYGLAKLLQDSGCQPDFLIGHSIGEFTAAVLAGVMSFEDAVKIVARRGSLMQSMPPGKMLAVNCQSKEAIVQYLNDEVCLAASNAPSSIALAGLPDSIMQLKQELEEQDIQTTLLETSHAFHSHMMEPIVGEFETYIESFDLLAPDIPIISTATGRVLQADEAIAPGYWASQLRNPVLFSEALASIHDHFHDTDVGCVEVGPGSTLTTLVSMQSDPGSTFVIPALPNLGCDEKAVTDIQQCLNTLWVEGFEIDWRKPFIGEPADKISLPGYAFQREVHWLAPQISQDIPVSLPNLQAESIQASIPAPIQEAPMTADQHLQLIQHELKELIEEITGYDLEDLDESTNFGEAGLDSLLLTQVATAIDRKFSIGITFRHLVEEYTTLAELGAHMAEKIPPKSVPVENNVIDTIVAAPEAPANKILSTNTGDALQDLVNAQLQVMQMQLQAFSTAGASGSLPKVAATTTETLPGAAASTTADRQKSNVDDVTTEAAKPKIKHTPGTRIAREIVGSKLTHAQQEWVDDLLERFQAKYSGSKALAQKHRKHLADPRTVSGFNPEWKEIVFPIVTEKSKGSKLWDIDGNELIDVSNGFGPIFFGHSPDFVTSAIKEQLDKGIETGPQSPIAGEVAELFCELTGYERCTFACTGSEAVAGAIRLARTVTGRSKVVMFEGSYHGIFDEVVTRPGRDFQALPAAPGIPRETTSNMLVLPWGEQESLDAIREYGPDLAAVLVEPVQSRTPQLHDRDYLKSIREITRESDTAMILDEVVTGFRVHSGGIRKYYDIDADLGTFGKVVGGGYPIGLIGGKSKYMDALDGGYWEYGDDSIPECGVTFFAGTFVRHPLALVAAKVVMEKIKADGSELYRGLAEKTLAMATEAKAFISEMNCDVEFEEFASFFYISVPANAHWGHLLFTMMTFEGIHIQQYRPCFLTTEHSDSDIEIILKGFKQSLASLILQGLIEGDVLTAKKYLQDKPAIPIGAKLGKNANGEPAYFIEDPNNKGKYMEVGNQ